MFFLTANTFSYLRLSRYYDSLRHAKTEYFTAVLMSSGVSRIASPDVIKLWFSLHLQATLMSLFDLFRGFFGVPGGHYSGRRYVWLIFCIRFDQSESQVDNRRLRASISKLELRVMFPIVCFNFFLVSNSAELKAD